jgi:hypothetical protein
MVRAYVTVAGVDLCAAQEKRADEGQSSTLTVGRTRRRYGGVGRPKRGPMRRPMPKRLRRTRRLRSNGGR